MSAPNDEQFSTDHGSDLDGPSRVRPAMSRRLLSIVASAALVVIGLDQFTKFLAVSKLTPNVPQPVIEGWLQWRLLRNPYAAFNLTPGRTWVITLIALAVVLGIASVVRKVTHPAWALAMGLLLGGAIGNLIDRLFREPGFARGHVVDFIEYLKFPFIDFPVFNVADSAIVVSAALIAVLALRNIPFDAHA